jgi:serine protease Do|tara:strand:- start:3238 stop:4533 length:1296 start_codon:yes stop_codon:yes gene_type:complete
MSNKKLNNGFFKVIKKFFKKPFVKTVTILVIAVTLSTVINSYYRNIQESIHKGIVSMYDVYPQVAEGLYEINGWILNGKEFDQERKAKKVIFENFSRVVIMSVFAPDNPELNGMSGRGTGFIVGVDDESATIVTNYHVIDAYLDQPDIFKIAVQTASEMWSYDAEIIGYDIITDVAVLKIQKKDNEEWEPIEWGTNENYSSGTPIVIIGHGMSMSWSSTQGHVVYKDRYGMRPYNLVMQLDAVVNQGNSGGPVFNDDGLVIGIVQSIYSPGRKIPGWDGVGMAISVDQVKRSVDYILSPQYDAKGYVPYVEFPFSLGSFKLPEVKDIEKEDRRYAYFDYPPTGSTAAGNTEVEREKTVGELAGFEQGDILLEINGETIYNSFKVLRMTITAFPGDLWTVKVRRGEEEIEIVVAMREIDIKTLQDIIKKRGM